MTLLRHCAENKVGNALVEPELRYTQTIIAMKKLLLFLVAFTAIQSIAQVTMTNNKPAFGTQWRLNSITSTFGALPAGADQVWDINTATSTPMYTYTVVDPSTLPAVIKDSVPTATFGVRLELGAPTPELAPYDFTKVETSIWLNVGTKGSGSGAVTKKNDTSFNFTLPYNSTNYYSGMMHAYAGYGTLKYKSITYNNVVMMKHYPVGSPDTLVQFYQFVPYHQALLSYGIMAGSVTNRVFWEPLGATGITEAADQLNFLMFPNPAQQEVTVVIPDQFHGSMELLDMTGKQIYHNAAPCREQQLDVSSFEKGIYLLQLTSGSRSVVQKLIVH